MLPSLGTPPRLQPLLSAGTSKKGRGRTSPKTRSTLCTLSLLEQFNAVAEKRDELHSEQYRNLKSFSTYGRTWSFLKATLDVFRGW